ncbi:MAG: MOSC domain-containing protein [Jhaorihella sp.]
MNARVAEIWRHPIKSHGRERVEGVTLAPGRALPFDRRWAVAHEHSRFDAENPRWQPCREFSIGAKSPRLQAISARTDPDGPRLTLRHPERPDITIAPDDPDDAARFIAWARPISNEARGLPARLVRAGDTAMTDTEYQSVSIINLATHDVVAARLGHEISPLRWRANLLIEGAEPWAEMGWIGQRIRLGAVEMEITEPITRCMATTANPETGIRDAETLRALKDGFGHQDCGVYARVTRGGYLGEGDAISVPDR